MLPPFVIVLLMTDQCLANPEGKKQSDQCQR
jgi:hypothetical protein